MAAPPRYLLERGRFPHARTCHNTALVLAFTRWTESSDDVTGCRRSGTGAAPFWGKHLGILGAPPFLTKYAVRMEAIQQYLVSASGQMSVPAAVRHRWHLDEGGPVDVIDLGFGVLTVPAGDAQRLLGDLLSREEHAAFVDSLTNDPDLATT